MGHRLAREEVRWPQEEEDVYDAEVIEGREGAEGEGPARVRGVSHQSN